MRIVFELLLILVYGPLCYRFGKGETARFVWNLLANNRSEGMAQAVCLYCANLSLAVMRKNGWKKCDDAYQAIKDNRELIDNC